MKLEWSKSVPIWVLNFYCPLKVWEDIEVLSESYLKGGDSEDSWTKEVTLNGKYSLAILSEYPFQSYTETLRERKWEDMNNEE